MQLVGKRELITHDFRGLELQDDLQFVADTYIEICFCGFLGKIGKIGKMGILFYSEKLWAIVMNRWKFGDWFPKLISDQKDANLVDCK
jgi:hypothetical protein